MTEDDLTLVPPGRLGALLAEKRISGGLVLDQVAEGSLGPVAQYSATDLRDIERGRVRLNDVELKAVMSVYGMDDRDTLPERAKLVIDLNDGALWAGPEIAELSPTADIDEVLGRYVGLLYMLRNLDPGSDLSLRTDDLGVLSASLQRSVTEVEQRLFTLMSPEAAQTWLDRVRHRVTIPAAGLLVGLTAVGSLVLMPFPGAAENPYFASAASSVSSSSLLTPSAVGVGSGAELGPAAVAVSAAGYYTPGDPVSVGRAAESLIDYRWQGVLVGWTVRYEPPRSGYRGNTNTQTRTIEVYVDASDTPSSVAEVLAHELGHALDVSYLTDAERHQWLEARDLDQVWWPDSGRSDFAVGAGDFAEAVAALLVNSPSDSVHGEFTPEQMALVEALIPR